MLFTSIEAHELGADCLDMILHCGETSKYKRMLEGNRFKWCDESMIPLSELGILRQLRHVCIHYELVMHFPLPVPQKLYNWKRYLKLSMDALPYRPFRLGKQHAIGRTLFTRDESRKWTEDEKAFVL
ncbi:hypothetical protein MKX03_020433, partial [Papaver bracteatum]